jgi:hypothetical protein
LRVFGIGLGRTGTTSLHRALEMLGFRSRHCPRFTLDPAGVLCVSASCSRMSSSLTQATLFGAATFDRDRYAAAYEAHSADVLDHFRGREADLLVMDICAGEGWEKLCPFLDRPVPDAPFPRRNVYGETDYGSVARELRASLLDDPFHDQDPFEPVAVEDWEALCE